MPDSVKKTPDASSPPRTPSVLRAAQAARRIQPAYPATRLIKGAVFEAEALRAEAANALREARQQAEAIVADARAHAQSVHDEASHAGFAEGERLFINLCQQLNRRARALDDTVPQEIVDLALTVARHLLEAELRTNAQRVTDLIKTVARRHRRRRQLTVHLHPDDLAVVRPRYEQLKEELGAFELRLLESTTLERFDVLVDSESGRLDGSLGFQMEQLRPVLIAAAETLWKESADDADAPA